MKASKKTTKTVKGWRRASPKNPSDRHALLKRCGRKAFLKPNDLKFPIMPKKGQCIPDCQGLRAAYARAKQFKHRQIASKAKSAANRVACDWARKGI